MTDLTTPLSDAIAKAEAAGACHRAIEILRRLDRPGATLACLAQQDGAAYWAYWYARFVIKGRWPEAEDTIAKDAEWACQYASDVIKGRWPEAEATIAKNAYWAYRYARYAIKGRCPEVEDTIAKNANWAYRYVRHVIKGRWPEVEDTIAKDAHWAYWYADIPGVPSDWRGAK